jgi:hypothetical protein
MIEILHDMYSNASTTIAVNGQMSDPILWNRGVIQGDPLSPLLFNICIDALLSKLEKFHKPDGVTVETTSGNLSFTSQAYADDVVLIGKSKEGMDSMLRTLSDFSALTNIDVAPHKCVTIQQRAGESVLQPCSYRRNDLPITDAGTAITYLGSPISGRKTTRISFARGKLEEIKCKLKMTFKSNLTLAQKTDATRTYILPMLDHLLANGQFAIKDLKTMDTLIRGLVDRDARLTGVPVNFFYTPAAKGGFGLPRLEVRQPIQMITKFARLSTSSDEKVATLVKQTTKDEATARRIEKDEESIFNDWKIENGKIVQEDKKNGSNCAAVQAARSCIKLNVALKVKKKTVAIRGIEENATNWKTATKPKEVARTLTQLQKDRELKQLKEKITQGHSFFHMKVPESNTIMTNMKKTNDNLLKFTIGARTNTLATPANIAFHKHSPEYDVCPRCQKRGCTLLHMLNNCEKLYSVYTWRHNIIASRLARALQGRFPNCRVTENLQIERPPGVPDDVALDSPYNLMRPDVVVFDPENNTFHILEISCPYGQISQGEDTIQRSFNKKMMKYSPLAEEIRTKFNSQAIVYPIIVSSAGVIAEGTKHALLKIFHKNTAIPLLKEFSKDALVGSAVIFTGWNPATFGSSAQPPNLDPTSNSFNHELFSIHQLADIIDSNRQNDQPPQQQPAGYNPSRASDGTDTDSMQPQQSTIHEDAETSTSADASQTTSQEDSIISQVPSQSGESTSSHTPVVPGNTSGGPNAIGHNQESRAHGIPRISSLIRPPSSQPP